MSNQSDGQKFAFCPIWRTPLLSQRRISGGLDPKYELNSPRAGGKYTVSSSFATPCETNEQKKETFNLKEKLVLSAWIAKENLRGAVPDLTSMIGRNDREAEDYFLNKLPPVPNPWERACLLLEGLAKKSDFIGKTFSYDHVTCASNDETPWLSDTYEIYRFFYALSYCYKDDEICCLLDSLQEAGFIHTIGEYEYFRVTVKGFEKTSELSQSVHSKTAFIAMWITSSKNSRHEIMENLYKNIRKAARQAGYEPLRIDKKDHIQKIDDQILVEINKSKFIVCDLSSEKEKPRGSVYFEAGYALGKTSLLYGHATRRCQRIWRLISVNTTACFGKKTIWRLFPPSFETELRTPSAKAL